MASQMKASVILGTPDTDGVAGVASPHRLAKCLTGRGAMRRALSCQAPVKYSVLGVAAMRALQAVQRTGAARERRQLCREVVTGAHGKPSQPRPQAGAKPRRQPLLAAEIDDVQ